MRKCEITGKGKQFGNNVSFSQRHTKKVWEPNLQKKTVIVDGKKIKLGFSRTIEGLTFSAYRRIATMIMVPAEGVRDSMEMLSIGSVDLANAQAADASAA